jgi:hypothetical protein
MAQTVKRCSNAGRLGEIHSQDDHYEHDIDELMAKL